MPLGKLTPVATVKHKQYHRRKATTVALGFCVQDGMVIAADRQVTAGDAKSNTGKIDVWLDPNPEGMNRGTLAVTGAGDFGYLKALSQLLREPFTRPEPLSFPALKEEFERITRRFYRQHVIPFKRYRENDGPDVELILAAERNNERCMWYTANSVVLETRRPISVGSGSTLAEVLFQQGYFPAPMADLLTSQILAAFVIFRAKLTIEGCGQDTDIHVFGNVPSLWHRVIRELEEIFRRSAAIDAMRFHQLLGSFKLVGSVSEQEKALKVDLDYLLTELERAAFMEELLEAQRRSRRVPLNPQPSQE